MLVIAALVAVATAQEAPAPAGTVVFLEGGADLAMFPGATVVSAAGLVQATESDGTAATARLRDEVAAALPLLDVFDGEIEIVRRLEDALAGVATIPQDDREIVFSALILQGWAAQRYFQDQLATDPAAAIVRVDVGGTMENRPWVDAIAMWPDRVPSEVELPDGDARQAYQDLRARHLLRPTSRIAAAAGSDARLVVDGVVTEVLERRVAPGLHRVGVLVDGQVRAAMQVRVEPDTTVTVAPKATAEDVAAFTDALRAGDPQIPLSPSLRASLAEVAAPVHLVAGAGGRRFVYRLDAAGAVALRQEMTRTAGSSSTEDRWTLRGGVGAGWVYDPEFARSNGDAPLTNATVNAPAGVVTVGLARRLGALEAGLGADLTASVGEHHTVQVGDKDQALRVHPWLSAGLPALKLAVGPSLPWRAAIGPRATIPLGPIEILATASYEVGVPRPLDDTDTFVAYDSLRAWAGIGGRLGWD